MGTYILAALLVASSSWPLVGFLKEALGYATLPLALWLIATGTPFFNQNRTLSGFAALMSLIILLGILRTPDMAGGRLGSSLAEFLCLIAPKSLIGLGALLSFLAWSYALAAFGTKKKPPKPTLSASRTAPEAPAPSKNGQDQPLKAKQRPLVTSFPPEPSRGAPSEKAAPPVESPPKLRLISSARTMPEQKPEKEEPPPKPQPDPPLSPKKPRLPSPFLLSIEPTPSQEEGPDLETVKTFARAIEEALESFGISGRVNDFTVGPVITVFELEIPSGIKISKVSGLAPDIARILRVGSIRVRGPETGKATIGIEVPNLHRRTVYFGGVAMTKPFLNAPCELALALGQDVQGRPVVVDLAKAPHLLVAGATGSGKSVALNTMIVSLLMRLSPAELRLVLIDPKRLELSHFEGLPHLFSPVVTESKDAVFMLKALLLEMEERYRLLKAIKAKHLTMFNQFLQKALKEGLDPNSDLSRELSSQEREGIPLPRLVVVIDELADLIMAEGKHIEEPLIRLAQMARASGIHLIVATQRPSVDIITGLIKANFPCRIALQVASRPDSRTILDQSGAETLLGKGDMLFLPPDSPRLFRLHGCYIPESDIEKVVAQWKEQVSPDFYHYERIKKRTLMGGREDAEGSSNGLEDERYDEALELVVRLKKASVSLIQRHLRIGYNRAARILERMELEGIVSRESEPGKPREVLIAKPEVEDETDA